MTALGNYRDEAHAWLASIADEFGSAARRGLSQVEDAALGRRYQKAKFEAGYAGINWPKEFGGQGLSHLEKLAFETEEAAFGMPDVYFSVSLGMGIPIVMRYCERGFAVERTIKALKGEEIWCQLFSEPAAGSDLAGLRLRATRDGEGWRLNGQKLWTSHAQFSDYGIILTRTDPTVPKHKGLTFFWVDMRAKGISVRPIKLAVGGESHVNEVFFDDVYIEDSQRMGAVGGGFSVAIETLMIERYAVGDPHGFGPPVSLFVDLAKSATFNGRPAIEDARVRQQIARNFAQRSGLEAITRRSLLALEAGMAPGPEGSINKLVSVRSRQRLSELALDLQGSAGGAFDSHAFTKENWAKAWLAAPLGRIAGGADEMLLNTIAEKILGLPQDHRPDKGVPFNEIPA